MLRADKLSAGAGVLPRSRDSSLEATRDWLEKLDRPAGRDRVLLCLDEFERLEEAVGQKPETKQQLVQLMGLLRIRTGAGARD